MSSPTPWIDTHAHFWTQELVAAYWNPPPPLNRTYAPSGWVRDVGSMGTSGCIFVEAGSSDAELSVLASWSVTDPVLGFVAPVATDASDVGRVLARFEGVDAFRGVRAHFEDGGVELLRADGLLAGLRRLAEAGVLYEFLVTGDQLVDVYRLCRDVPDLPVVIEHMGKPRMGRGVEPAWRSTMAGIAADTDVVVKLSFSPRPDEFRDLARRGPASFPLDHVSRHVDVLVDQFGPDRLVWGSDWPVSLLTAATPDFISSWHRLLEPLADRLTANARRVYRLPTPGPSLPATR